MEMETETEMEMGLRFPSPAKTPAPCNAFPSLPFPALSCAPSWQAWSQIALMSMWRN